MPKKARKSKYRELLDRGVVIFDGAMGTNLELLNLSNADFGGRQYYGCNDHLVISKPLIVERIHRSFLEVGVDVVETNTFRANRKTLSNFGLEKKVREINIKAASLCRRLADEYSTNSQPRLVAGAMGPNGALLSNAGQNTNHVSFDEIVDIFYEQALALIEGGVDILLLETQHDILEVKAAVIGVSLALNKSGISLPIQVQVTLDKFGRMLLGTEISAALAILQGLQIDVIGINCSAGPEDMQSALAYLSAHSPIPISCLPNAGMPFIKENATSYPLSPSLFAEYMKGYVEKYGIQVIGGCCGTTPDHLHELITSLNNRNCPQRKIINPPLLSSAFRSYEMKQNPPPFLIGERLNTQGSRIFKHQILQEKYIAAVNIAKKQIAGGAHGLDVCTALTENALEEQHMISVIDQLSYSIDAPFVIDSTDPLIIEQALKHSPGRSLINSVNLESGFEKAEILFQIAKKYNAAIIALTIDQKGMAKTAERKLEIAQRIFQFATQKCHLNPSDLVFDLLTFSLASGENGVNDLALQTLKGLEQFKVMLPDCATVLGISNVSYGFSEDARKVLNSVFLYHAIQAGLDMAILHAGNLIPYPNINEEEKKLAENLIFIKNQNALYQFSNYFENNNISKLKTHKDISYYSLPIDNRIYWKITHQSEEGIIHDIDEYMNREIGDSKHDQAIQLLNDSLLPAMKKVGEQFSEGELILPFVLHSAEIMQTATNHLEKYIHTGEKEKKGTIILATVFGDVHDIGKNLVKVILENNGYNVIDLGKQVHAETIVEQAKTNQADAVGLSALLVSTSQQMPLVVQKLIENDVKIPVLIGGAAVNDKFAHQISKMIAEKTNIQYPVFYCSDAFSALDVLGNIVDQTRTIFNRIHQLESKNNQENQKNSQKNFRNNYSAKTIPTPPFWGYRIINPLQINEVISHLNKNALYRFSWGAKNAANKKWEELKLQFEQRLYDLLEINKKISWLEPKAAYGFWPVKSRGDSLVIFDESGKREISTLEFPRQKTQDQLCIADYFLPETADNFDVIAFQTVTVGRQATTYINSLLHDNNFVDAFYAHGLAVQLAEASAIIIHNHIRKELELSKKQGKRYSWGYDPVPDLSHHSLLFKLMPIQKILNIELTAAYQFIPEHTTAAMVVHNPQAKYFTIRKKV